MPQQLNPELNPDLRRDVDFFTKWGHLIAEDAISADQVESLRIALDEVFATKGEQLTHQLL